MSFRSVATSSVFYFVRLPLSTNSYTANQGRLKELRTWVERTANRKLSVHFGDFLRLDTQTSFRRVIILIFEAQRPHRCVQSHK